MRYESPHHETDPIGRLSDYFPKGSFEIVGDNDDEVEEMPYIDEEDADDDYAFAWRPEDWDEAWDEGTLDDDDEAEFELEDEEE